MRCRSDSIRGIFCDVCLVHFCLQIFDIPFNSANKWSLAVTESPGDKKHQLVFMKGAPEIVLTKCSHHYHNREEKPLDDVSHLGIVQIRWRVGLLPCMCRNCLYPRLSRLRVLQLHVEV